ncbi:uncharacterized protein N7473_000428 [Penicillium subrubescens]|uniref:uncharacterized protein n=1 Tax=Penicillium subrubescens TaxID=1316194 RepID=UPI0025457C2C|nr:uncharacterized protein N7473_000428 [Penicillium subrubescens]KAJ5911125.1 hypothetical protein N7473_000428 [Penicillium subrubescens]
MMDYAGSQLNWPQSEARQPIDDYDAEAEAEANKQRRKVQNRKNRRAHQTLIGLRLKPETRAIVRSGAHSRLGAGASTSSTIFPPKKSREHLQSTQAYHPPQSSVKSSYENSSSTAHIHAPVKLDPKPFTFPLSLDHLLHLIQYNVFRAFIFNMHALNTVPADSTICTMASPCRDDTALYPLKPDIPPSLIPIALQ